MKEYLVIEHAYAYGISIRKARRFTDEEKSRYAEWFRETGFVRTGDSQDLKHIRWDELPDRLCDGSFLGCDNQAWIITPEEAAAYKALNEQRAAEKVAADRAREIKNLETMISRCEGQRDLPGREEARRRMKVYNDINNEGGDGYVPHIYSREEYEWAKAELAVLHLLESRPLPAILGRNILVRRTLAEGVAAEGIAVKTTELGRCNGTIYRLEYMVDENPRVAYELIQNGDDGYYGSTSVVLAEPVAQDESSLEWLYRLITRAPDPRHA